MLMRSLLGVLIKKKIVKNGYNINLCSSGTVIERIILIYYYNVFIYYAFLRNTFFCSIYMVSAVFLQISYRGHVKIPILIVRDRLDTFLYIHYEKKF